MKHRFLMFYYLLILSSIYINFILFYLLIDSPIEAPKNAIGPIIYTLISSLIFSIPILIFSTKNWFLYIYLICIDLLLAVNVAYYEYYNNIIPFFSYSNATNLSEIIDNIHQYFKLTDFSFLISTILVSCYFIVFKNKITIIKIKVRIKYIVLIITLCFSTFVFSYVLSRIRNTTWEEKLVNRVEDQTVFVSYYGLIPLWTSQIYGHLYSDHQPITPSEQNIIHNFLQPKVNYRYQEDYNSKNDNKNLIIIIVESLNTWAIKYNAGKATPFLSKLTFEKDVIFIPNVLPQVKHGRSADAQLIINTGLLPVKNNTVANLYSKQNYPSLAEALKNEKNFRNTLTIMGNKPTSWNQKTMNLAYHIDNLISINELNSKEIIGMGISDKSVFSQSVKILENSKKPFFCQIITLSSHDGNNFNNKPTNILFPETYSDYIKNYIKSIEYVDNAIESFINELKSKNLYENSVIIITGDHNGPSSKLIKNITPDILNINETNDVTLTPLYIVNSGQKYIQQSNQVIGEIDIYPSILSIMGLKNYFWKGVGTSVFSKTPPSGAVGQKLNFVGDSSNYDKKTLNLLFDAWEVSDLIIRKKFFDKNSNKINK